jgi:putative nucleotidyltransferase with HDIG domain
MTNNKTTDKKKQVFQKGLLIKVALLVVFTAVLNFSVVFKRGLSLDEIAGTFLIIALLLMILYKDFIRYKPLIYRDYKMLMLIGILLSVNYLIGRGVFDILEGFTLWLGHTDTQWIIYAIPLAMGSMLAALLIDIHTAIVFTVITSLLAGVWLGNPLYAIFSFAAGLTSAFGVMRCKRRSAIWKAGLLVGLVNVYTALIIQFLQGQLFVIGTPLSLGFALLNGLIVATLVSAFLPLFEYLFKLTTDISLLELVDLNQPLMRSLLVEAPGTYHHSIMVGNLVEAAAEAVEVNPLLARVSAYYHDIGKVKMPEYFVENQRMPVSRHEKLAPRMSSLILMSHVKEGVELAKKHKLPESIIDSIQQHHGTSVMTYFFEKAKEQSGDTASQPTENDFRYPGPKPQTRVAALVLMADAVEAASRAELPEDPAPARISDLVDKIVNRFFLDGQLDSCELTLKDLREIKSHFVYLLASMFRKRIHYPGFEIRDEGPDKQSAELQTVKHDKNTKGSPENPFPFGTVQH